jgi:glutamate synthase (NADPH/NADH) large chain
MVEIGRVEEPDDVDELKAMIERHSQLTGSTVAQAILDKWSATLPKFVKVLPKDYKRVLEAERRVRAQGLSGEEATMAAFLENIKDLSRVSGN